jgi:hypothetical protein
LTAIPEKKLYVQRRAPLSNLQAVSATTLYWTMALIHDLPVEMLSEILKHFIHDYFDEQPDFGRSMPAVLHVCHCWRQLAINSPHMWTTIKVNLGVASKRSYFELECSDLEVPIMTIKKNLQAMKDILDRYFSWSEGRPVDFVLVCQQGSPMFYDPEGLGKNTLHWLSKRMPKLRTFTELYSSQFEPSLFLCLLPSLEKQCYSHLVEIHITNHTIQGPFHHDHSVGPTFSFPSLRAATLPGNGAPFLARIAAPNLCYLMLSKLGGIDNPALQLQHLPSLTELAIGVLDGEVFFIDKHEGIHQLVLSECFHYSVRDCLVSAYESFPNFSELTLLNAYDLPHFISLMEDRDRPVRALKRITSLSLVRLAEYNSEGPSPLTNSQCKVVLGYFPNLARLSLGGFGRSRKPRLSYRGGSAYRAWKLSDIRSFIEVITETSINSEAPLLHKLEQLDLVGFHLDREILSLLTSCLQNPQFGRSGSGDQPARCHIALRRCHGGSGDVPILTQVMSLSELHHLLESW